MNLFRSLAAVIGTLGVALTAGNLFQLPAAPDSASERLVEGDSASLAVPFSDAAETDFALPRPSVQDETVETTAAPPARARHAAKAGNPLAGLRKLARTARQMPAPPAWLLAARSGAGAEDALAPSTPEPDPLATIGECDIRLVATPEPQAMLALRLYAPCDGGARVEIRHEALHFSQTLTNDGQLTLRLPALADKAHVTATLSDGRRAENRTEVPDIALADRLLLVWQGADALALSAHLGAAARGDDGHFHPLQPGNAANGTQQGFVTLLGEPALDDAALAQIYTFPAGLGADSGHVDLAVEAAITPESCGQQISAETRLIRAGREAAPRRLSLTLPACDGFEGFLVIDGLIPNLTLARN